MGFNEIFSNIITKLIIEGITSIVKYIAAKLKPKIINMAKKFFNKIKK